MPRYKNIGTKDILLKGEIIKPGEEVVLDHYVNIENLALIDNTPLPKNTLLSDEVALAATDTAVYTIPWGDMAEQATLHIHVIGKVYVYFNESDDDKIILNNAQLLHEITPKNVASIKIEAVEDSTVIINIVKSF